MAVGSVCTFDTTLVSTFYSNWNQSMGGSVVAVGSVCTFHTTLVVHFTVTGISLWGSVVAVGSVCTFYTTLVSTFYRNRN